MKRLLFLLLLIPALSFGQTVLTSPFSEDFQEVYDAFTEKPSDALTGQMDGMVRACGTYWDSLDVFYLYAAHTNTNDEALINWTDPGTFNATAYSSPTFTALPP